MTDYYYSKKDSKNTPRRINEGKSVEKDFIMSTYSENEIPDNVFALPSYCTSTCPPTTICGKFQFP